MPPALDETAQAEQNAASPDFCPHIQPVYVTKFQSVGQALLPRFLLFLCHLSFLFLLWFLLFCKLFSWFGNGRYTYWRWPVVLHLAKYVTSQAVCLSQRLSDRIIHFCSISSNVSGDSTAESEAITFDPQLQPVVMRSGL